MKKINVWMEMGLSNCIRNEVLEVENDATDEEIEEIVQDWFWNYVEFGWNRKD